MPIVRREQWILKRCEDRAVLHLGCADCPLTAERLKTGRLLHEQLARVASGVSGVDVDADSLNLLRQAHFDRLYCHNIEELGSLALVETPDIILAGEVMEHISNVGQFLESCKHLMAENSALIVSVPNAFSMKRCLFAALTGMEHVHPDHTAYFSPSTIHRIAECHGYRLVKIHGYMWENPTLYNFLANLCVRAFIAVFRSPIMADGLIAEMSLK